ATSRARGVRCCSSATTWLRCGRSAAARACCATVASPCPARPPRPSRRTSRRATRTAPPAACCSRRTAGRPRAEWRSSAVRPWAPATKRPPSRNPGPASAVPDRAGRSRPRRRSMNSSALPFRSSDVTAPPDALDWLRVQWQLRRLSRHLGNGESSAPARAVRALAYRFGGAPIGLWQARAEPADSGAHTRALARVWAGRRFVGAEPLYAAFAASADAMLAAPPSIATRRVDLHVAADRLPAVGVEMRGILADVADDVSVYLHGSRAAGDETPFSDVDDLVVVHASA